MKAHRFGNFPDFVRLVFWRNLTLDMSFNQNPEKKNFEIDTRQILLTGGTSISIVIQGTISIKRSLPQKHFQNAN